MHADLLTAAIRVRFICVLSSVFVLLALYIWRFWKPLFFSHFVHLLLQDLTRSMSTVDVNSVEALYTANPVTPNTAALVSGIS